MDTFIKNARHVSKGFTLIELLVVIIILAALVGVLIMVFNPITQIEKARNATREQDFAHIKTALDTYYNDTGCYPSSIPFGASWSSGTTVYMEKVPEDPDCTSTNKGYCYVYQTDGTSCPQWNILYAQLHAPVPTGTSQCLVASASNCLPSGGLSGYNYCAVSGKLDCTYLTQNPVPSPTVPYGNGGSQTGGTYGPGITPIPTSMCRNGVAITGCNNKVCDSELYTNCAGCGGTQQCYADGACGGVDCSME